MNELFLKLVNLSITAGWIILAAIIIRLVFKKAPKWISCALWALAALRLVFPFSIESAISLIPSRTTIRTTQTVGRPFSVETGIGVVDTPIRETIGERYFEGVTVPANNFQTVTTVLGYIWLAGLIILLVYALVSYLRLTRNLKTATLFGKNIKQSEYVPSPFILGIFKPTIYLPYTLSEVDSEYVLAHEKAHIRRKDHIWKPLGFLILCVYWFNPLVWIAYILMCRDIEAACDEKVIRELDDDGRKAYSTALLNCSVSRRKIMACPVAFGETDVKSRIKNVMNYKKPAFWIIIFAIIVCIAAAVSLLTDPLTPKNTIMLTERHVDGSRCSFTYVTESKDNVGFHLSLEIWQKGRRYEYSLADYPANEPIQLGFVLKQYDGENTGFLVQTVMDSTGVYATHEEDFYILSHPIGWSSTCYEQNEKISYEYGDEKILAAVNFDFGDGVKSHPCKTLDENPALYKGSEYMIIIRAEFGEPEVKYDTRPMLKMDGVSYVDPYKPVSMLPFGYEYAGKLTAQQANGTGLEGIEYFTNPHESDDFYTYQECGTPVSVDEVDTTQRQMAYLRWIPVKNNGIEEYKLTLDDVIMLSEKGDDLTWADFERYSCSIVTDSQKCIKTYPIDSLFWMEIRGDARGENATEFNLCAVGKYDIAQYGIDIREDGFREFIEEQRNRRFDNTRYVLTAGSEGIYSIEINAPYTGASYESKDGYKIGDKIYPWVLDEYSSLRGVTIIGYGKDGEIIFSAGVPDVVENDGFTHLGVDGWTLELNEYSINIIDSKETKLEKSETESELDLQSLPASMIRILYDRNLLIANTIDYDELTKNYLVIDSLNQLQEILKNLPEKAEEYVGGDTDYSKETMSIDTLCDLYSQFPFSEESIVVVQLPQTSSTWSAYISSLELCGKELRVTCKWGPEKLEGYSEDMIDSAVFLPIPKEFVSVINKVTIEEIILFG